MRIVFNEIKRFYRPVLLLLIAVLTFSWYLIYESSCNLYLNINVGMPYKIAKEYIERFGSTIDSDEIEEVRKDYEASAAKLNQLISQTMGEYGINTIDEYDNYNEKYWDTFRDETSDAHKKALAEWGQEEYTKRSEIYETLSRISWNNPVKDMIFETQTIRDYIESYDFLQEEKTAYRENNEEWFFCDATEKERSVLENRLNINEIPVGIRQLGADMNFKTYSDSWSLLIFICCALLILPLLVKNKISNIPSLQYTSKQGRKILLKQLLAALISSFFISLVLIVIFQLFYFKDGAACFLDCPINLSTGSGLYWYNFTFLGYMIFLWTKTILLALCETFVLFWISYYSKNYITATTTGVPVIAAIHIISSAAGSHLFMFLGYHESDTLLLLGVSLVLTVIVSLMLMIRENKADYLLN